MIRLLLILLLIFYFVCPAAAQTSSQPVLLANGPVVPFAESVQPVKPPEMLPEAPPVPPAENTTAPVVSENPQSVVIPEALPVAPDCVPAPVRLAEGPEKREKPSVGLKIVDVALVRPFCVIGSTVSTAVYIAISPLAAVMGLGEPAARAMVEAPWRFTAFRYVGEFNHYKDEQPIMGVWDFL